MSAPVQVWLDGPDVYVSDIAGTPRPVESGHARTLADQANRRDDGLVKYGPDWFHRDALLSAAELVERKAPDQCANCHDACGTRPMGDNNDLYCDGCASAAQGSIYDDKEAY